MGHPHPAPSPSHGQEQARLFRHKRSLLFGGKLQVAVTLRLRGQRGKNPAAHTKVSGTHMGPFFDTLEA